MDSYSGKRFFLGFLSQTDVRDSVMPRLEVGTQELRQDLPCNGARNSM